MQLEWAPLPQWMRVAKRAAKHHWPYANHPLYTDDPLVAVVEASEQVLGVCWVPYSLKWASDRNLLKGTPPLHTLSVCAVVTAGDKILTGKRSGKLLSYPDCWEFAPAGGVGHISLQEGRIHLEKQLLAEWKEEICPNLDPIELVRDVAWLYCQGTGTWTRVFHICSKLFNPPSNQEVQTWRWIDHPTLNSDLQSQALKWVPGSLDLLQLALPGALA